MKCDETGSRKESVVLVSASVRNELCGGLRVIRREESFASR